jgi:hypothetical protein
MRYAKPFFVAFALALAVFAAAPSAPAVESSAITYDTNGDGKADSFYVVRDQNNNIVAF